jgi:hypothetical protein
MRLPFTREEFFDLLAAYNSALWPAVVAFALPVTGLALAVFGHRNWKHHFRALR